MALVHERLQAGARPEAMVLDDDLSALGAIRALRDAGVQVPQDVAVVGFDGLAAGKMCDVPLTTVAQPVQAVAEQAVQRLLVCMDQRGAPVLRTRVMPTLVIRTSCGASLPRTAPKHDRSMDTGERG